MRMAGRGVRAHFFAAALGIRSKGMKRAGCRAGVGLRRALAAEACSYRSVSANLGSLVLTQQPRLQTLEPAGDTVYGAQERQADGVVFV